MKVTEEALLRLENPALATSWHIRITNGKVIGPATKEQVCELAAAGKLRPEHEVSKDGENWHPATRVKWLTFPSSESKSPRPPAPARRQWFFRDDSGEEVGPFSAGDVDELVANGTIRADTSIRLDDDTASRPAKEIPGLLPDVEVVTVSGTPESLILYVRKGRQNGTKEEVNGSETAASGLHEGVQGGSCPNAFGWPHGSVGR